MTATPRQPSKYSSLGLRILGFALGFGFFSVVFLLSGQHATSLLPIQPDTLIAALAPFAALFISTLMLLLALPSSRGGLTDGFALISFLGVFFSLGMGIYVAAEFSQGTLNLDLWRTLQRAAAGSFIFLLISMAARRSEKSEAGLTSASTEPPAPDGAALPAANTSSRSPTLSIFSSVSRSLMLSTILLAPGIALTYVGERDWGVLALFIGSLLLLLRGYAKPWRITFLSIFLPVFTTFSCWGIQLYLFFPGDDFLPMLAWPLGIGLLLGAVRGCAHRLWRERELVFARRTFVFILVWALSFALTQLAAVNTGNLLAIRSGLLSGAFSCALVLGAGLVLLLRRGRVKHVIVGCAPILVFFLGQTPEAHAQFTYPGEQSCPGYLAGQGASSRQSYEFANGDTVECVFSFGSLQSAKFFREAIQVKEVSFASYSEEAKRLSRQYYGLRPVLGEINFLFDFDRAERNFSFDSREDVGLSAVRELRDGRRYGLSYFYYPRDGGVWSAGLYADDQPIEKHITYDANLRICDEQNYLPDGRKHGRQERRACQSGQLDAIQYFVEGFQHGLEESYSEGNLIARTLYKRNERVGGEYPLGSCFDVSSPGSNSVLGLLDEATESCTCGQCRWQSERIDLPRFRDWPTPPILDFNRAVNNERQRALITLRAEQKQTVETISRLYQQASQVGIQAAEADRLRRERRALEEDLAALDRRMWQLIDDFFERSNRQFSNLRTRTQASDLPPVDDLTSRDGAAEPDTGAYIGNLADLPLLRELLADGLSQDELIAIWTAIKTAIGGADERITVSRDRVLEVTIAAAGLLAGAGLINSVFQAVSLAVQDAAETAVPPDSELPSFIDPWDGEELHSEDGKYWAAWEGDEGRWLDQSEMASYIQRRAAEKQDYDQELLARKQEEDRLAEWTKQNRKDQQTRLANERQAEAHQSALRERLGKLQSGALERSMSTHSDRLTSDALFNADGSINESELRRAESSYRKAVQQDVKAGYQDIDVKAQIWDEMLLDSAASADAAVRPLKESFVARIGFGAISGGMSEIVFQGHSVAEAVWERELKAMSQGKTTDLYERLGAASTVLAEENLPVGTVKALARKLGGDDVSFTEVVISGLSDVAAGMDLKSASAQGLSWKGYDESMKQLKQSVREVHKVGVLTKTFFTDPENFPANGSVHLDDLFLPPDRLTTGDAKALFDSGAVSRETEALFKELKKEIGQGRVSDDLLRQIEAYDLGRRAGLQRVNEFKKAADALTQGHSAGLDSKQIETLERALLDQTLRVQADKHAMNQMNALVKDSVPVRGKLTENSYVKTFNQQIDDLYSEVDKRMIERLAQQQGVDPSDIQIVAITNLEGKPAAGMDLSAPSREHYGLASDTRNRAVTGPEFSRKNTQSLTGEAAEAAQRAKPTEIKGKKVSFDRDLTVRKRVVDASGNTHWPDIEYTEVGKVYHEAIYEAATGRGGAQARTGDFIRTHLSREQHLIDPLAMPPEQADEFAKRLDQATTDRLNAEAYGTGQADLDTATKDVYRGRDLTDPEAVANTIKFKVHHWVNEGDDLRKLAAKTREEAVALGVDSTAGKERLQMADELMMRAEAHYEEGARQLTKQYKNMAITRTENMLQAGNAPYATLPRALAEDINVLRRAETDPTFTIAEAMEILDRRGTNVREVGDRLSRFVEGQQLMRSGNPAAPLWLSSSDTAGLAVNKSPTYAFPSTDEENHGS